MAEAVLVAGTRSHVGKSTVAAGLCRLLRRQGVSVAPFKAQNMSNNAEVALKPDGRWGEIAVSQHTQARAAEVPPSTDMNPVLLKPRGEGESEVVVHGDVVGSYTAEEYYDDVWWDACDAARRSYERLESRYDAVVLEGAGGAGEVNLQDRDLANVEAAEFADADVVLVADLERGGAFASVCGTLELMPEETRQRVVGVVFNKFRGDPALLKSGFQEVEQRTDVPVLGVLPYDDPDLPAEDSLDVDTDSGAGGGDAAVRVAVLRYPRISNFTDLEPLSREPGVSVEYLEVGDDDVEVDGGLDGFDAVVLPGSKNTVDDLLTLKEAGFSRRLRRFDGFVVGVCGGYQMLGDRLERADAEGTGSRSSVEGLGLLPVVTEYAEEKEVSRVERSVEGAGAFRGFSGEVSGYEIHLGRTTADDDVEQPFGPESAAAGDVVGTYLHGLFHDDGLRDVFLDNLFDRADETRPAVDSEERDPYGCAADLLESNLDLEPLLESGWVEVSGYTS